MEALEAERAARYRHSGDPRKCVVLGSSSRTSFATTDPIVLQAALLVRRFGLAPDVAGVVAPLVFAEAVR
jgi:hypothetical protein